MYSYKLGTKRMEECKDLSGACSFRISYDVILYNGLKWTIV